MVPALLGFPSGKRISSTWLRRWSISLVLLIVAILPFSIFPQRVLHWSNFPIGENLYLRLSPTEILTKASLTFHHPLSALPSQIVWTGTKSLGRVWRSSQSSWLEVVLLQELAPAGIGVNGRLWIQVISGLNWLLPSIQLYQPVKPDGQGLLYLLKSFHWRKSLFLMTTPKRDNVYHFFFCTFFLSYKHIYGWEICLASRLKRQTPSPFGNPSFNPIWLGGWGGGQICPHHHIFAHTCECMRIQVLIFFYFSSFWVWKRIQHFWPSKKSPFSQDLQKLVQFAQIS